MTAVSSQIEPNQIGENRAERCGGERHEPVNFADGSRGAGRQQPGCGRQRNAQLLDEYRREQYRGAVSNQKLKRLIHGSLPFFT